MSNSPLGRWLFPYSYANRSVGHLYYPQTFLSRVENELEVTGPTLLAIHLNLIHWPFSIASDKRQLGTSDPIPLLQAAKKRMHKLLDEQLSQLWTILESKGLLENAKVVVFSDHGEAFLAPGERLTSEFNYQGDLKYSPFKDYMEAHLVPPLNTSLSHGTDVLSDVQQRILLAFRGDGWRAGKTQYPTSLIDIAPTLMKSLALPPLISKEGQQLNRWLNGSNDSDEKRFVFMESGFIPQELIAGMQAMSHQYHGIDSDYEKPDLKVSKILQVFDKYYTFDGLSQTMKMKPETITQELKRKQYAVTDGALWYVSYPNGPKRLPVVVELSTGKWWDGMQKAEHQGVPVQALQDALRSHFNLS